MRKNSGFMTAMAALLLVFGLVLAGCDPDEQGGKDDNYGRAIALEKEGENVLVFTLSHGEWKNSATTAGESVIAAICNTSWISGSNDLSLSYAGEIQSDKKTLKITVTKGAGDLAGSLAFELTEGYPGAMTESLADYTSGFDGTSKFGNPLWWTTVEGKKGPVEITFD